MEVGAELRLQMCSCGWCPRQWCQADKKGDKRGDATDVVSVTHEVEEANLEGERRLANGGSQWRLAMEACDGGAA